MGKVLRFPIEPARAVEQLERERTVAAAFAAIDRGDFDAHAVREVIRGNAGTWSEFVELCERMKLVARVLRACGYQPAPSCGCTARCSSWPHCRGGPEGI